MAEFIAYLFFCFLAGVGVAVRSGLMVGLCMGAAYWLGVCHG